MENNQRYTRYIAYRRIIHFIYPTRCPMCGEIIGSLERFCTDCHEKLIPYREKYTIQGAESFTAAFVYEEKVSPIIDLLKHGNCGNADYALGGELADRLISANTADKIDIIVPVPLRKADKRRRGFNQAELIARVIGLRLNVRVYRNSVIKIRKTDPQKDLNRQERMLNLHNAFSVARPELVHRKRILLVDDICTTGSTLAEVTSVLLKSGAKEVHCASCFKTPPK